MFIQVIQGQITDAGEMRAALDRWHAELAPGVDGWLGTTAGVTDDGMFVNTARFESQEVAWRNSERPEQGQWWAETAKLFSGEVAFHDCTEVYTYLEGGSDSAGFVQVMQGRIRDPERMHEVIARGEQGLAGFRPDLIGGFAALHGDGGYTEVAYFTSEQAAREGEGKPLPAEMRELFEAWKGLFEGEPAYFDLRDPWLYSPRQTA
ncbi:hypothetical protein [Nonomuraea sp. NEAU-A123]|uniref:hypothetical protein n=1 Tax=Nonomuraea sp. NEAU-A123 TaxID=2839649 RepID=UPI001BE4D71E|nr:hypothetical protein [Nonomuraea sp. NEAU-A123]MBT2230597.1 hypothetical protein [Nonomuraea sp. NEAU-A123]